MDDIDGWLAAGSRPEADVSICLAGDLAARYQAKAEEIVRVAADPNRSLTDTSAADLAAELDALQAQMETQTRTVRLRALTPEDYLRLQVSHPPRPGDDLDGRVGANHETFLPALVAACTVSPDLTDEQWLTLRSKLSSRQWDELWVTAQQLNREDVRAPLALRISEQMRVSGERSKPPGSSASRSNGSGAGSRKRSTRTTPRAP